MKKLLSKVNMLVVVVITIIIYVISSSFINTTEDTQIVIDSSNETPVADSNQVIYVDIKGAVVNPGMYEMKDGERINDAIEISGGFKDANEECLNLSEKVHDEDEIIIPANGDECDDSAIQDGVVNINEADIYELMQISGIGETRAQAIIDYRDENGNFQTIEDIKNVSGIGDATFDSIKQQITV